MTGKNGHRGNGTNIAIAGRSSPNKTEKPADQADQNVQPGGTGKDDDDANIFPAESEKAEISVASPESADSCAEVGEQSVSGIKPSVTNQSLIECRCQTFSPNVIPEGDETLDENQRCAMPIAAQTLLRLGEMYLELLPLLAHERWSQMSFDIFIEQMLAVGVNDYERRKEESAIACRLRAGS